MVFVFYFVGLMHRSIPVDDHPMLSLPDTKDTSGGVFKQVHAPLHFNRKTTNVPRRQLHKRGVVNKEAGDIKVKVQKTSHHRRVNRLNLAKIASNVVHGPEALREYSIAIQPHWDRLEEVPLDQVRLGFMIF